jgi:hypothetical protein
MVKRDNFWHTLSKSACNQLTRVAKRLHVQSKLQNTGQNSIVSVEIACVFFLSTTNRSAENA